MYPREVHAYSHFVNVTTLCMCTGHTQHKCTHTQYRCSHSQPVSTHALYTRTTHTQCAPRKKMCTQTQCMCTCVQFMHNTHSTCAPHSVHKAHTLRTGLFRQHPSARNCLQVTDYAKKELGVFQFAVADLFGRASPATSGGPCNFPGFVENMDNGGGFCLPNLKSIAFGCVPFRGAGRCVSRWRVS